MSDELTQDDYRIINKEVLYKGHFSLVRYQFEIKKFSGEWSSPFNREIFVREPAAAVLLYDPKQDKIVLIKQFRGGALQSEDSPWLTEIVAGVCDNHDDPELVARREALEEAGCKVLEMYPICEYFTSPGASNEMISIYCGRVDLSHDGGIFGLVEEDEDIKAMVMSVAEGQALLDAGKLYNAPTIIALMWLREKEAELKRLWGA